MFGDDPAVPVQKKCDWQSQHSSISLAGLGISHHYGIIHAELPVEVADGVGSVIHRHADDLQAVVRVGSLQFDKVRSFFAAGLAPCCPEIEEHNFATISRES